MQAIIEYVRQSTELIIAIGALIVAAIAVYRRIEAALAEKYKDLLRSDIITLIANVERNPLSFNHTLVNKVDISREEMQGTDGKTLLAIRALQERSAEYIKCAGLANADKLYTFVVHVYNQVYPFIGGAR